MSVLSAAGQQISDNIELIIFDKDGTLLDVHHYWVSMIKLRAERFSKLFADNDPKLVTELAENMGANLQTFQLKPEGPVGIKPRTFIIEVVQNTLRSHNIEKSTEEIEAVFKEIDKETKENLKPLLKLLPGVEDFLISCRQANVIMAIATTDISIRAQNAMEALGLDNFFDYIYGAEKVEHTKPAPDLGKLILEKSNKKPSQTVMIGDHPVDIEMGKNCEFLCNIGVLTGLANRKSFEQHDCQIINSLEELSIV